MTRNERTTRWADTMDGFRASPSDGVVSSHEHSDLIVKNPVPRAREQREAEDGSCLADGATLSIGAGRRIRQESPDPLRTCFERDRDRIVHSSAFRRLAGKTQVFISPKDHQRTRLTHALEVAQVGVAISSALRLNVALTEAIALGHDCGHGPGGHPSEDVFTLYLEDGFDHAPFGADVMLAPLNLCLETLDGIRNHSWSRPASSTPEGEVVSWADRIAYVCHDFEDAMSAGIVTDADLPEIVRARCGTTRSRQISAFIHAVISAVCETGRIGMFDEDAAMLGAFRRANYERIYFRPDSMEQAERVRRVLEALVEAYAATPALMPSDFRADDTARSANAYASAVTYVAGMTDRYAFDAAVLLLDWPTDELPRSVGGSA